MSTPDGLSATRRPTTDLEPWERQLKETSRAFACFAAYRDIPAWQRSIRNVIKALYSLEPGENGYRSRYNQLCLWSTTWNWVDRCKAWDAYKDTIARQEQIGLVKRMHARHAGIALAIQDKAYKALEKLDVLALKPATILKYFVEAARLERSARGEPETLEETLIRSLDVDLATLTDEQIEQLAEGRDILDVLLLPKQSTG